MKSISVGCFSSKTKLRGKSVAQRNSMKWGISTAICILWTGLLVAAEPVSPQLRLAFVSNREHYWYPHIYLYEHDGRSAGQIAGSIQPLDKRLDHQPVLSADGRVCVYGYEMEGGVGRLGLWDFQQRQARELDRVNQGPNAVFSPSLSADGQWLAFTAWGREGGSARWDVFLYDVHRDAMVDLPGVNSLDADTRRVALSGDGRWLAYTTLSAAGQGRTDIFRYDRETGQIDPLEELNSPASDSFPSLSRDGRLLAFASDRTGGQGGLDIYLFDCETRQFVHLPGLNSPGHEQTPSLTSDGRWIAFVSERLDGAGEHDIYLYDRQRECLLETPGLNTERDEYDPSLIVIP
jgi:Tol biopolymer transport system component